jgi:hypothetical protein
MTLERHREVREFVYSLDNSKVLVDDRYRYHKINYSVRIKKHDLEFKGDHQVEMRNWKGMLQKHLNLSNFSLVFNLNYLDFHYKPMLFCYASSLKTNLNFVRNLANEVLDFLEKFTAYRFEHQFYKRFKYHRAKFLKKKGSQRKWVDESLGVKEEEIDF